MSSMYDCCFVWRKGYCNSSYLWIKFVLMNKIWVECEIKNYIWIKHCKKSPRWFKVGGRKGIPRPKTRSNNPIYRQLVTKQDFLKMESSLWLNKKFLSVAKGWLPTLCCWEAAVHTLDNLGRKWTLSWW